MPLSGSISDPPSSPRLASESSSASTFREFIIVSHSTMDSSSALTLTPSHLLPDHPTPLPSLFITQAKHVLLDLPTEARWWSTAMQIVASKALERNGSFTASQQKDSKSKS